MILSAVRDEVAVSWNGELLTVLPESARPEVVPLIEAGIDELRAAGFTVVVSRPEGDPMLLLEHLGNKHDQKSHARKGAGRPQSTRLKEQLKTLDADLRTIRGAERIVAIDPATGKVTLDKGGPGTAVEITLEDDIAMMGTVATHNHPTGWNEPPGTAAANGVSFSSDDMMTAWRAGVAEMRVAAPGATYTLKPGTDATWGTVTAAQLALRKAPPGGPPGALDAHLAAREQVRAIVTGGAELSTFNTIGRHDAQIQNEFWGGIHSGTLTVKQAMATHHEELARRVSAELGWEYSIERTPRYVDPMSLNEAIAALEQRIRLLEHPGHSSQKVHGRRGAGPTDTDAMGNAPVLVALSTMGSSSGALDTMGKVLAANGFLTDNPAARAASAAQVSDEIRHLDIERGNLIFPNGAVYRGPLGTENRSEVPAGLQQFASIDIHNHPSGASLSPTDVMVFDTRVPKQEVRVVSTTADYSLTAPGGWGSQDRYMEVANDTYRRVASDPWSTGVQKSNQFWADVAPQMGWQLTARQQPSATPRLDAIFTTTSSLPQP